MPFQIEHEGQTITVWKQEEVDQEVAGLKTTNQNLKDEKKDLADKLSEAKESVREMEEAKAKAEGDNETLQRLADEREAEKQRAIDAERQKFSDLLNMTKQEKITNFIDGVLDDVKPVDSIRRKQLKKLLKVDFEFDVDLDKGEFTVRGENVTSVEDLKRVISESEDYQGYIAGSDASGGGSAGGKGAGVTNKPFSEMNDAERLHLKQTNPAAFQAALNNR